MKFQKFVFFFFQITIINCHYHHIQYQIVLYAIDPNRTKSCIIQTLLENKNTQQTPPAPTKSDFKVPNKYVRTSKTHLPNNTYISPSNGYQELSNDDDTENKTNIGDNVKPTKPAEPNKNQLW